MTSCISFEKTPANLQMGSAVVHPSRLRYGSVDLLDFCDSFVNVVRKDEAHTLHKMGLSVVAHLDARHKYMHSPLARLIMSLRLAPVS